MSRPHDAVALLPGGFVGIDAFFDLSLAGLFGELLVAVRLPATRALNSDKLRGWWINFANSVSATISRPF